MNPITRRSQGALKNATVTPGNRWHSDNERSIRTYLTQHLTQWTGAIVTIDGSTRLSYFPRLTMEISNVRLLFKSGGKHGSWINPDGMPQEAEAIVKALS